MMMFSWTLVLIVVIQILQVLVGFHVTHVYALPVYDGLSLHGRCHRGAVSLFNQQQQQQQRQRPFQSIRDGLGFAFDSQKARSINIMRRGRRPLFLSSNGGNNSNNNNNTGSSSVSQWLFTRKKFLVGILLLVPPILLEAYSRIGTLFIPNDNDSNKNKNNDNNNNNNEANKKYYSFIPTPEKTDWSDVEHATIVFHGAGGEDAYTDELMKGLSSRRLQQSKSKSQQQQQCYYNHIVDWSKYSTNILQASYNGQRIGKMAAKELLEQACHSNLKTIHFIGISVGAFAADAAVNEVKRAFGSNTGSNTGSSSNTLFVQLTLLDPFQQRGIFGVGYGNKEFGRSADYAEQYLNTDDPVPSTNKPLKNTVCYDVTNLRPENIFGHDWPLVYYARSDHCGELIVNNQTQNEQLETGTVVVL